MKLKLIPLLALLAVAIAGVSYAAIPSANGTITACKDNKGALKVIDAEAGQSCPGNSQALTWNQQGPAGQAGISGYEIVSADTPTSENSGSKLIALACPEGKRVLGGGGNTGSAVGRHLQVYANYPGPSGKWWYYGVLEEDPIDNAYYSPHAFVICGTVST